MDNLDIDYNLYNYVKRIEQQIEVGKFVVTESEDFFLRLFSVVYNLESLQNLNYVKPNTKAIDLIDRDKKIGIQITAQKSSEYKKIETTINGTIVNWKEEGINKLWVFFISETDEIKKIDTTKEYSNTEGISVWITNVRKVIGDINSKFKEDRIRIAELIKQEVSPEYHGLSKLTLFKQILKGQKIVDNPFFNLEDTIYLSKKEYKTINLLSIAFDNGRLKEYCILGNPCSGKTTFAYSLIQKISRTKVFYINLSNPSLKANQIVEELIQISHNNSLIIIDNIHDNIEFFKLIRERVSKHKWVCALYLSRYFKTNDELDTDNIYRIINGIKFFRIDANENFIEKVSGILWKKTKQLKEKNKAVEWRKGNFQKILRNINNNLLKLNIALRFWENKNNSEYPIYLDSIDTNKILEHFYDEHNLHSLKSDALYTYCLLYKNDVSFIPIRNAYSENKELKEKGIVLKYYRSDFCFLPHKEYAQLIYDSFVYIDAGISIEKKANLILNYLRTFDTKENTLDLLYLLTKFYYSTDNDIIPYLLEDESTSKLIINAFTDSKNEFYQVNRIITIIHNFSNSISNIKLADYFNSILKYLKSKKLHLFIYEQYMTYTKLLQISDEVSQEFHIEDISISTNYTENIESNSIVELTLRISRKSRETETVLKILNTYTFPEWLKLIVDLPRLTNITNSLSELNTSSESKKLLVGLIRNIDWNEQYNKSKLLKVDQLIKSFRELQKIDISVGTNISNQLLEKAFAESLISHKLKSANLSEYSKALSDLSKIDSNFVKNQLKIDLKNNALKEKFAEEESISNFTARALELKKHVDNTDEFLYLLSHLTSEKSFIDKLSRESNLNYLLIFNEFVNNHLTHFTNDLALFTNRLINELLKKIPDKLIALSNPKFLKITTIDSDFIDSISPKDIEKYISKNKISNSEDLFRVLSSSNIEKTIQLFNELNINCIVKSLLNPELNFSQSIEILKKIKSKVYKNKEVNCNKNISQILNNYLDSYRKITRRYSKVSISDFFIGYYFGYCINPMTIEMFCKNDFLVKLRSSEHKGFEISSLFQFTRRISEETNGQYDKELLNFLEINTNNFIEVIRNEDIIKTLSGLCELSKSNFASFADNLLFNARGFIIKKAKQRKNEEIYKVKIIPDLEKIGKNKGKIVLRELMK